MTNYKEQIISRSGKSEANVLALKQLPMPLSGSYKCEYNCHNQDHLSVMYKQKNALNYRKLVKPSGWNLCVYEYKWWQLSLGVGKWKCLIWSFLKWRNFKRLLNFIKGLHTHACTQTFFWQVLLSCLHIPSGRVQAMILYFFFVLQYCSLLAQNCNSKLKNCSRDANTDGVLPAFCNFPLTLRCIPCVRGGYESRHSHKTPLSLLMILHLIKWFAEFGFNKAAQ